VNAFAIVVSLAGIGALGPLDAAADDEPATNDDMPSEVVEATNADDTFDTYDTIEAGDAGDTGEPAIEPAPVETAAKAEDADGELGTSERGELDDDPGDQGVGAAMGIAAGGRVTPGGLRFTGHYLYQLSSDDWFDGTASFTFGGGDAACFSDRMATTQCGHDFNDGNSIELAAGVRRMFAARGQFRPFARAAVGLSFVRFRTDDVTGLVVPLHLGGGVRARVAPGLAVVGQAEVMLGFGSFSRGLGAEPQLGMAVTAGAEFELR
jgi:hypothetical protein